MRLQIAYATSLFVKKKANISVAHLCKVYRESAFTKSVLTQTLTSLFRHYVLFLLQLNLNFPP